MDNTLTELLRAAEAVIADRTDDGARLISGSQAWENWHTFVDAVVSAGNDSAIPDGGDWCDTFPQPPADTVTIERISEGKERMDLVCSVPEASVDYIGGWIDALKQYGLIKPYPDPYQEHISKHGLTNTVEARAMFDSFQEVR